MKISYAPPKVIPQQAPLMANIPQQAPLMANIPQQAPLMADIPQQAPLMADIPQQPTFINQLEYKQPRFSWRVEEMIAQIVDWLNTNGATMFAKLLYNTPQIKESWKNLYVIIAPIDAAMKRLETATGRSIRELNEINAGQDIFSNHIATQSLGTKYPILTSINGRKYGSTDSDMLKFKIQKETDIDGIIVRTADSIIYHETQITDAKNYKDVDGRLKFLKSIDFGYELWKYGKDEWSFSNYGGSSYGVSYYRSSVNSNEGRIKENDWILLIDRDGMPFDNVYQAYESYNYIVLLTIRGDVRRIYKKREIYPKGRYKHELDVSASEVATAYSDRPNTLKISASFQTPVLLASSYLLSNEKSKYADVEAVIGGSSGHEIVTKIFGDARDIAADKDIFILDQNGKIWIIGNNEHTRQSLNIKKSNERRQETEDVMGKTIRFSERHTGLGEYVYTSEYLQDNRLTVPMANKATFIKIFCNKVGLLAISIDNRLKTKVYAERLTAKGQAGKKRKESEWYKPTLDGDYYLEAIDEITDIDKVTSTGYDANGISYVTILDNFGNLYDVNMNIKTGNPGRMTVFDTNQMSQSGIDRQDILDMKRMFIITKKGLYVIDRNNNQGNNDQQTRLISATNILQNPELATKYQRYKHILIMSDITNIFTSYSKNTLLLRKAKNVHPKPELPSATNQYTDFMLNI